MAGRPRSFDRDAAIDRFVNVFWSRGYSGTSVDDLQAAVGINRSSFYAAFVDKETAYRQALARYFETVATTGLRSLASTAAPRAGLAAFIRFAGKFLASQRGNGCLLLSTIAHPPVVEDPAALEHLTQDFQKQIATHVRLCAKQGELLPGETVPGLSAYVLTVALGLNGMSRSNSSAKSIRDAAELAARYLENGTGRQAG